jgi:hypothetical protein
MKNANNQYRILLPGRFATGANDGPAVWPDVSPTPSVVDRSRRPEPALKKQILLTAPVTLPAQAAGNFTRRDYFFLETFFVFFAVFFTALFAFFAFLAFLAMLPSWCSEMASVRCVHSGIEMHCIPNTPTHRKKQRLA